MNWIRIANKYVDKRRWRPFFIFFIVPIILIFTIYILRKSFLYNVLIGLGILLFGQFVSFLYYQRRNNLVSIVAMLPILFGPLMANMYIGLNFKSDLYPLLDKGGSTIVQLSFYFAGVIGLLFFLLDSLNKNDKAKKQIQFHILILFLVMIIMGMTGQKFIENIVFSHSHILPNVTPLLLARALLVLNTIAVSTWPKEEMKSNKA